MRTWKKHGFVPPSENKALDGLNDVSLGLPLPDTSEVHREAKNGLRIDFNQREAT
jgi:hypothetical protein